MISWLVLNGMKPKCSPPPHISKLKEWALLPDDVPFSPALPPDVHVPPVSHGKIDDFIDDLVSVGFASSNWRRLRGACLLALLILGSTGIIFLGTCC